MDGKRSIDLEAPFLCFWGVGREENIVESISMKMGFPMSVAVVAVLMSVGRVVEAYENYTVGDSLGWYDRLMKPDVDYPKWAAAKNFSLGDFLIFNTDTNHTVIQTYNSTTYKSCDYDDAEEDDTTEWSNGNPSYEAIPVTVAVPLLKEGLTYFFSGDYDGEQCKNGQRFQISVAHGQGLPASLLQPTPTPHDDDSSGDSSPIPPSDSTASTQSQSQSQSHTNAANMNASFHIIFLRFIALALLFA